MRRSYPPFCVILTSILPTSELTPSENTDYGDLCPFSNLCTTGPSRIRKAKDTWPCCFPCSCSSKCNLFGNCCPDKGTQQSSINRFPCKTPRELYNTYFNRSMHRVTKGLSYRVIDLCPTEALKNDKMKETISLCHHGNKRTLKDLSFVSDIENTAYFNKHCATCNGVHNYTEWNLAITCPVANLINFENLNERDEYFIDNCDIISTPPTIDTGAAAFRKVDAIRDCNNTGRWDYYDPVLEDKCRKHEIIFRTEEFLTVPYANVYCFLCNVPKGTPVVAQCQNPFKHPKRVRFVSFSALIVQEKDISRGMAPKNTGCKQAETLDPFMLT